jgi:NADH:ubiquinone reductase (H+-translocating)
MLAQTSWVNEAPAVNHTIAVAARRITNLSYRAMPMDQQTKPRVAIVGAGFGGPLAARTLARYPVQITLVDRQNFHIFQPLPYQVATAGLSPDEIAAPIRWIMRSQRSVEVLMSEVRDFDLSRRVVKLEDGEVEYDYLIVAAGASHAYFGHDEWEPFAPGLKTIEDALEIRRRVLLAFELAERKAASSDDKDREHAQLNFVVVGGGPTGVELAGTLAEISRQVLANEFRSIDPKRTRIVLLEGGPRVLPAYPEDLSRSAEEQLRHLGVEVQTSALVTQVEPGCVHVGESKQPATVILWAAGVAASPLGKKLGAPVDRAGRVLVNPDLSIPGHPEVFVVGDLAALKDENGKWLPGVAPVAMQEGKSHRPQYRKRIARRAAREFPLLEQRQPGNHWSSRRRGRFWKDSRLAFSGLVVVVVHPHIFPDRFPQSADGSDPVGMVLSNL